MKSLLEIWDEMNHDYLDDDPGDKRVFYSERQNTEERYEKNDEEGGR